MTRPPINELVDVRDRQSAMAVRRLVELLNQEVDRARAQGLDVEIGTTPRHQLEVYGGETEIIGEQVRVTISRPVLPEPAG